MRIVSAADDMLVKVWDLVLNTEIATIKSGRTTGSTGRATCFTFSKDFKTMIVGYRDGTITFFNTQKEFKMIHSVKCGVELGFENDDDEVNAIVYLTFGGATSYLAIGGTSGKLVILDLSTMEPCHIEDDFIASETTLLHHRYVPNTDNPCGQLISINADQNMLFYEMKESKVSKGSLNKSLSLQRTASICLYLDEVIDVRFISENSKYALLCSNSETLKLLDMDSR